MESLHVTIGILSLKVEEMPEMRSKMKRVAERFQDLLMFSHGFMITTGRAGFGDNGATWLEIELGRGLVFCLREILEDEAIEHIADLRFSPHVTIFQKSILGTEERAQLQESSNVAKLGAIVATGMTLREKKGTSGNLEPVESWYFRSTQTVSEN